MKKRLYLMRHGQTLFNLRHKIQGHCDSPLTELGKQQALSSKKFIDQINLDHAYSSTSERAVDTLELVLDGRLPYTRLKTVKEMNFGTFEGESEDLNPKDRMKQHDFFVPYGGEDRLDVQVRMVNALTNIMNQTDHENVLVVSHAGASMGFLSKWHDPREILPNMFPNGTILIFDFEDNAFKIHDVFYPEM